MISAEIEKMIVITGDDVNVRNKADISGKVLMSLPKGKLVEYIKQNEEVKIIKGISGRWIFVNTKRFKNNNDNKTVVGWIFEEYLGMPNKFKRVENWNIAHYEGSIVDTDVEFDFNKDGSFKMYISYPFSMTEEKMISIAKILKGEYNKKRKKIELTGHLYKYKNIYWAKNDTQIEGGNYYFFLNDKGEIELNLYSF